MSSASPAGSWHGDLTGNVLFGEGLAPAIIDFSPYWRPKSYASAVVAVDAVVWFDADVQLLSVVAATPEGAELLARALLLRLLAHPRPAEHAHAFRPAIEFVERH